MSYDRMFRGQAMTPPTTTANDIYRETIMESRMHPAHCTCAECAPRPVGESKFNLPLVIFLAIMAWALFGGIVAHILLD